MPMNLMQQMDVLKNLSDQQLAMEMQTPSGGAAPFMVAAEISRRKDMRERYANQMATRKPNTTVVEDLMGSAMPTPPGAPQIAAGSVPSAGLDAGLAPVAEGYADGGIVGAVDYDTLMKRYSDRLAGLDSQRDRAAALALIAAGAGIMGGGHSNTLQNVGIGAQKGLDAYAQSLQAIDTDENNILGGLTDLTRLQHAEELSRIQEQRLAREAEARQAAGGNRSLTPMLVKNPDGSIGAVQLTDSGPPVPVDLGEGVTILDPYNKSYLTTSGGEQAKIDAAIPEKKAAATNALNAFESQSGTVQDLIDTAKNQANFWTTGLFGEVTKGGNQWAIDLEQTLNAIKANIGFDKLQAMRDASPTGGALGPVSDTENKLLQAVNGSLEQKQSKPQLVQNLDRIMELYERLLKERREAYEKDFGGGVDAPPAAPVADDIDAIAGKYLTGG